MKIRQVFYSLYPVFIINLKSVVQPEEGSINRSALCAVTASVTISAVTMATHRFVFLPGNCGLFKQISPRKQFYLFFILGSYFNHLFPKFLDLRFRP